VVSSSFSSSPLIHSSNLSRNIRPPITSVMLHSTVYTFPWSGQEVCTDDVKGSSMDTHKE
jgi:hypothetical protein